MSNQYFPSNGSEGEWFTAKHCENCYKYHSCTILANSLAGKEPKQWIYDDDGNPVCTSFSSTAERNKIRRKQRKQGLNQPDLFQ